MLIRDLDLIYTNKVKEYLNNGYTIHTLSMSGSQGEMAKIDLVKGKEIVRIYTDTEYKSGYNEIHIYVGISDIIPYNNSYNTIWNSHLKIIEDIVFYTYKNYITSDKEEILNIKKKADERRNPCREDVYIDIPVNDKTKAIVLRKINSLPKCKSIKNVKRIIKYYSKAYGKYIYYVDCKLPTNDMIKHIKVW